MCDHHCMRLEVVMGLVALLDADNFFGNLFLDRRVGVSYSKARHPSFEGFFTRKQFIATREGENAAGEQPFKVTIEWIRLLEG